MGIFNFLFGDKENNDSVDSKNTLKNQSTERGLLKEYYKNGKLKSEDLYRKNGLLYYKNYYENGNLKEEGSYNNNDCCQGYMKQYYENGNLKEEGNYDDGQMNGEFKFYNNNGELIKNSKYIKAVEQ